MAKKVLFAGESWTATVTEVKGFNAFSASKYETGLGWIDKAIEKAGYEFVYMPNHIAADHFPYTMEELKEYACVVLSDIGADTLLIPTETFSAGKRFPNRCQLDRRLYDFQRHRRSGEVVGNACAGCFARAAAYL